MKRLTISQVARECDVNVETVKYYEKRGLLPKPDRNGAGYRIFTESTIHDLKFIKQAQRLGFSLEEIKHLLAMAHQGDYDSSEKMYDFAVAKVQELQEKIAQLQYLEEVTRLPKHSFPLPKRQCPVLHQIRKG